jgi:pyruvate-ferredoxin/flavodoxin oxidoreductase
MDFAQKVVDQKWALYEEMATRDEHEFMPDTRIARKL